MFNSGKVPGNMNSTFLADFRPILLCNCVYKIVSKVIALGLKPVLSSYISEEQFGFLQGSQIREAIGSAQELIHSIKSCHILAVVLKMEFSKAYDRVSWLYLHLLFIHISFSLSLVRRIMGCVTSSNFAILINGSASDFFKPSRGLCQGCLSLNLQGDSVKGAHYPFTIFYWLLKILAMLLLMQEGKNFS
jgi:hypothetical protein